MKYIFIILLPSFLFANTPLENQDFDIKKFSGLWYEIARVENSFQTFFFQSWQYSKIKIVNKFHHLNYNEQFFHNEKNKGFQIMFFHLKI